MSENEQNDSCEDVCTLTSCAADPRPDSSVSVRMANTHKGKCKMKDFDVSNVRLMSIAFIIVYMVCIVTGQTEDSENNSTAISAAGPRLGPVVVVEVTFPDRDALDELARAGYDISNVQGNVATIYASLEELERLKETGYPLREIGPRTKGFELMSLGGYHNYTALTDELNTYAEAHPDICRLYTLGQSVQGRELWAMLITDNPDDEEDEPEFKYVSTIHGNEPEGAEMCLYFIDLLLTEYGQDDRITNLVNSTAIWIVPLMSPDGLVLNRRGNANGTDLNRNFPSPATIGQNIFDGGPLNASNRQPEVQHIMNWMAQNSFVLSADFHAGEVVVLYPYSYDYVRTPDDALFQDISRRYSVHNPPMWNNSNFSEGIASGADWFIAVGTAGDWCYSYLSCNAVTIELYKSQTILPASQIPALWNDNSESMLSFLEAVHIGVRGIITDRASGEPLWAEVHVEGNSQPVFTDPDVGDYHRMLLPGMYDLVFHVPGYLPRGVRNVVVTDGPAIRVDIELLPEQASPDFNLDRKVDIEDLLKLIEHWGQDEPLVDIAPLPDGDGIVDKQDVDLFMEYWQEEIPIPEIAPYLIALWRLDEREGSTANDSVGGNDASVIGDPVWQPAGGQVNGALQLDGIDDYVSTDFVLNPADGQFSIFAWIKGGEPGQVIISQADDIGTGETWLGIDALGGNLMTGLVPPPLGRFKPMPLESEFIITDGQWHRIGFVWDGSYRSLYVDGVEVAKDTLAPTVYPLKSSYGGLYIGAGKTLDAGTFFSGLIDDIRIYNRAVSP